MLQFKYVIDYKEGMDLSKLMFSKFIAKHKKKKDQWIKDQLSKKINANYSDFLEILEKNSPIMVDHLVDKINESDLDIKISKRACREFMRQGFAFRSVVRLSDGRIARNGYKPKGNEQVFFVKLKNFTQAIEEEGKDYIEVGKEYTSREIKDILCKIYPGLFEDRDIHSCITTLMRKKGCKKVDFIKSGIKFVRIK